MIRWPAMRCCLVLLFVCLCWGGCSSTGESNIDDRKDSDFIAGQNRARSLDYPGAVRAYKKALESNPHSASAHFEIGLIYYLNLPDYAAAIYHFQEFLELRPTDSHAENVRQFVSVCKQELARTVSLGPIGQKLQKELEQLTAKNQQLRQQVDFLSKSLSAATNRTVQSRAASLVATTAATKPAPSLAGKPRPPATRNQPSPHKASSGQSGRHVVRPRETIASIARQHRLPLGTLLAANPGVEPRRMKIGQVVTIPVL
ncbi:MAG: tetratricopeptide repeat protein [Verrucomicrobiota bacterium]